MEEASLRSRSFGGPEEGDPSTDHQPNAFVNLLATIIRLWALLGGLILVALALMSTISALSNLFFGKPFSGDYELVKHFVAIAIFMFLPYTQLVDGNVTVDIFTERASARAKAAMALLAAIFAIGFAVLLLRQMSLGLESYITYRETTPVLRLPLWTAFPPILISLALLLVAAVLTALDGWRAMRRKPTFLGSHGSTIPIE